MSSAAPGLHELRIEGEDFFLRATSLKFGFACLRRLDLRLCPSSLCADVGIVELKQELALAHVVAFLDQQAFHCGRDGSMRFEVLNRLNLAIGGNQAADRAALNGCGAHPQRSLAKIGIQTIEIATTASTIQIHRRLDGVFELFINAN